MEAGIELGQVEAALAGLRGVDHAGSVRATTLNLVVWAPDDDAVERAEHTLTAIGGSRPLRAIVLRPGKGRPMANVASSCWDGGGREVCSERVAIEGDPDGAAQRGGLVAGGRSAGVRLVAGSDPRRWRLGRWAS